VEVFSAETHSKSKNDKCKLKSKLKIPFYHLEDCPNSYSYLEYDLGGGGDTSQNYWTAVRNREQRAFKL